MNPRTAIIVVLSWYMLYQANGQDRPATGSLHILSVSTGLSNHQVRDDIISPLIYRGNQMPVVAAYEYAGDNSRHAVVASYDRLELTSRITDRAASAHVAMNVNASLGYSYARKVSSLEEIGAECFLGGSVQGFLNWRTFHYTREQREASFEGMLSLGLNAVAETRLGNSSTDRLSLHISIPLISYVLLNDRYNAMVSQTLSDLDLDRDPAWQILTNGSLVTVDKLFKIETDIRYRTFVLTSVAILIQYKFLYYSFAQFNDLWHAQSLTNQALVGLVVVL
jgi:hypothetical protein